MEKKKNVPVLRFPEFSGEIEMKALNDVSNEVKRLLSLDDELSEIDVLTISSEKGFISQKERFSQIIAGQSISKYIYLKKGEMSYNKGASKRFQYGCFFSLTSYEKALVPNVYISFAFNNNCETEYYNQLFSKGYANNQLRQFISSSVRLDGLLNINRNEFFSIRIPVPTLPEQQIISSFFTGVDNKLNALKNEKTLLEQYKKGMMQKIFSQELRFKDDNGNDFPAWKRKKLGQIFNISAGGDIGNENVSQTRTEFFKYPIYANAEKNKGLYGFSDIFKINENVVTISGRGNLGIAHARNHKFYPIVRLLVLRPKNDENIYFFEYCINGLNIFSESTGVPQLTAPQISTYSISYPSLPEQTKIANFLSTIDDKINLCNTQIEKTEQWKKGLLQKMFV